MAAKTESDATFRNTKQKLEIMNAITSLCSEHFTAEELIQRLREDGSTVGRATVYRFLRQLRDTGTLKYYPLSETSGACFQYTGGNSDCDSHCHVMCSECGSVLHIDESLLRPFAEKLREEKGFDIDETRIVFYGRCRECKNHR